MAGLIAPLFLAILAMSGRKMFLDIPFIFDVKLQNAILILNTLLLILALIVLELVYIDAPKEKRRHLIFLYPFMIMFIGVLLFAFIKQTVGN